jgi:hypothetical protein
MSRRSGAPRPPAGCPACLASPHFCEAAMIGPLLSAAPADWIVTLRVDLVILSTSPPPGRRLVRSPHEPGHGLLVAATCREDTQSRDKGNGDATAQAGDGRPLDEFERADQP